MSMDSELVIDLSAIRRNYLHLQKKAKGAITSAVVKANAYGLGVAPVATKLYQTGCRTFFVANIDEAVELRSHLAKDADIYVLHGVFPKQESTFVKHRLFPVLNSVEQIKCWQSFAKKQNKKLRAILHVDTGMNRLGISFKEAKELADGNVQKTLSLDYVMSHLSCISEPEREENTEQLKAFNQVRHLFPDVPATLANSAGVLAAECYHFDMVRPGCALYGIHNIESRKPELAAVATINAPIVQLRQIDTNGAVGYGATKAVKKGSMLATVPLGYADGYLRALSNSGVGFIAGKHVPIMGRVSMDLVVVDLTSVPKNKLNIGTKIEFLGKHCLVDDVANRAGTIGYEILTNLGHRYKRRYIGA